MQKCRLKSTHKHYSTQILVQSYNWKHLVHVGFKFPVFAQNCKVNDIFVHFQDICSTNTIFMQKCRLKSNHKHYSIFLMLPC